MLLDFSLPSIQKENEMYRDVRHLYLNASELWATDHEVHKKYAAWLYKWNMYLYE